jgi:beta-galactosidase
LQVWCNKKYVGFSKDSRLPAEFEITNLVRTKDVANEIEVVVLRYSDASYLEDQDMYVINVIDIITIITLITIITIIDIIDIISFLLI